MLRVEDLTVVRGRRPVVRDVSFEVTAGEVVVLLGPNGSGKSSCLGAAAGDLPAARGRVTWGGERPQGLRPAVRAERRAVLPQAAGLDFDLTVEEVVLLGRTARRGGVVRAEDIEVVAQTLAEVDLVGFAPRSYLSLSGGERQRVQLARVLAQIWRRPAPLLLLDEPTSALDVAHAHAVLACARRQAARGAAVLVVLHDLMQAMLHADRVVLLSKGRVAAAGAPREVLTPARVEAVYGLRMRTVAVAPGRVVLVPDVGTPVAAPTVS